ncbi:UdgX family uracil-DNA binding protein [Rhizobium oryzicola]|uniref:Type-4 uracil-DNA glycosylase n=1 Tax=Rhizobium oryzicola TaxID=1232668 RepID=A0ABT8SXK8_9HYPH|nr:UdgX family uracil-DNA binding protein [Rhizobium oryzicola]MDO1582367.1 UdgX family uracil-DNA binding protein [Rhizobium oryzicola]
MWTVTLNGRGDLEEWRDAARAYLRANIKPEHIDWRLRDSLSLPGLAEDAVPEPKPDAPALSVPPQFLELAEAVICHSDPIRFSLLYRLLWRLCEDRNVLQMLADEDVVLARKLEKSVRRDSHKMTAFVRFKEIAPRDLSGHRRAFFAWFEPDHFIVARKAPFFRRRFVDMDWVIATPKGSAAWDGEVLTLSDEPAQKPDIRDATDDLWRTYYANIFNPARLKVKAMTAEMPKKYWKNLPEAELIPQLIADAETKVLDMAARQASQPPTFHERLQKRAVVGDAVSAAADGLAGLQQAAASCTLCPLHCAATQTVFGEGPERAEIMIVGEQPGDQEDLAGRPFVGPAGKVFDTVAAEVGLDRSRTYVTNAVKHFKYEPRGKRRIHQKPNQGEVQACRFWLSQEIQLVQPKLIVAMGATAYYALTDGRERLEDVRGRPLPIEGGRILFVTVHPSYLLRIPDEARKADELARYRQDLARVGQMAVELQSTKSGSLGRLGGV